MRQVYGAEAQQARARAVFLVHQTTLVVAGLCLVLMFVPSASAEESEDHTQHARWGTACGLDFNCRGSCCFGVISYCYDSRVQQCFHPTPVTAVVCSNTQAICDCTCYDPSAYYCVRSNWWGGGWTIVPKPTPAPTRPLPPTPKPTVATTLSPTTVRPTTPAPTTKPTTAAPTTTPVPTTLAPTTTPAPTTPLPTTPATTRAPTTLAPTTPVPTTPTPTTPVPTTPAPPPRVTTSTTADNANNGIVVSSTLDPGITTYDIYRSSNSFTNVGDSGVILLTTTNGSAYEDFNIVQGQQYCYAVVPRNGNSFNPSVMSSCNHVVVAITGLTCGNTGPVPSGSNITFYSSIATGTDVSYMWTVNDGGTAAITDSHQNFTTVVYTTGTGSAASSNQAQIIAMNAKGRSFCETTFVVTN